ncbi:DUF1566 domain-containing protein [Kiritimatiellaeota bacterium B1221]|nr:DUF1566 domain-containing protein [Kiritimatiellaeota bacterium B1221]
MKKQNIKISGLVSFLTLRMTIAAAEYPYPIVDTSQTTAYGNVEGQDAHYAGNAPSYQVNGDGTVSDQVTGLMWTRDPGEKITLDEALAGAETCRVGGYSDWRLPSIKELYSLVQLNGTDPDPMSAASGNLKPFIDDTVFKFVYGDAAKNERIIDSQFASRTKYVSTTMKGDATLFGVNFADGRIKGYGLRDPRGRGAKTFFVLYVRGNEAYGVNQFKDNGDGTVLDEATGLTWMKSDSVEDMDWPTALAYAENFEYAGKSDWRLPNAKELQSIIDYTRSPDTTDSAAIDPIFESTAIINEGGQKDFAHYWTSTTHAGIQRSDTAIYFAFGRALGWMTDRQSGKKILMDVHGAGSQRSDPKVGDASVYPYGRGPQGDVIRIQNKIRLVRGGDSVEKIDAPATEAVKMETQSVPSTPAHIQTPPAPSGARFISRLDRNGDGKIAGSEFDGPPIHFSHFDKDHDGFISEAEAPAGPPQLTLPRAPRR